ncbi:uncharacterized protein G2W53_022387 [Senna tora]|uniref:Uncharacterized protein n=1 Tax=Senna tora TaxID=362788 RepID=A0A834TL58_9FABA|nr:uncharacterized protein G2W53_022387 [Senna tora]
MKGLHTVKQSKSNSNSASRWFTTSTVVVHGFNASSLFASSKLQWSARTEIGFDDDKSSAVIRDSGLQWWSTVASMVV